VVSGSSAGSLRACARSAPAWVEGRWRPVGFGCWVCCFVGFIFYLFFFSPPLTPFLALVSLADVAAGGGGGSGVIAWDLGASLSSPFSPLSGAAVAKGFL